MYKLRHFVFGGMLSFAVLAVLLLSVVGAQAHETSRFDMNDRAAADADKGGSGFGKARVRDGELRYKLRAEGLRPNGHYDVVVTVNPGGGFGTAAGLHRFASNADDDGELEFEIEGLALRLAPGTYRLDFLVTNTGLLDFVLACQPFTSIIIE